jgi:hypothetical protein
MPVAAASRAYSLSHVQVVGQRRDGDVGDVVGIEERRGHVRGRESDRAAQDVFQPGGDVRLAVERLLEQVLPLDDERRTEGEVWLAFAARAQSDPALREQRDATHKALGLFVRRCVDALAEAGVVRPELSRELEASRLHALVDGLAVHGITSPETMTPRRMRKVLRAHLATLA